MKIARSKLKQIIKEELTKLSEVTDQPVPPSQVGPEVSPEDRKKQFNRAAAAAGAAAETERVSPANFAARIQKLEVITQDLEKRKPSWQQIEKLISEKINERLDAESAADIFDDDPFLTGRDDANNGGQGGNQ